MLSTLITPHVHARAGVMLFGVGVHLYTYVCDAKKSLNGTLAVDSPFQILTVDFLSNLYLPSYNSAISMN